MRPQPVHCIELSSAAKVRGLRHSGTGQTRMSSSFLSIIQTLYLRSAAESHTLGRPKILNRAIDRVRNQWQARLCAGRRGAEKLLALFHGHGTDNRYA